MNLERKLDDGWKSIPRSGRWGQESISLNADCVITGLASRAVWNGIQDFFGPCDQTRAHNLINRARKSAALTTEGSNNVDMKIAATHLSFL